MSNYLRNGGDIFVVGQVSSANNIGVDFTSYTLKRALRCSPPTARKHLNKLVDMGLLVKEENSYRNFGIRFTYHITEKGHKFFYDNRVEYINIMMKRFGTISFVCGCQCNRS